MTGTARDRLRAVVAGMAVNRILPTTIIGLVGLFLVVELWAAAQPGGLLTGPPGFDLETYLGATRRFLGGGGFYPDYQLAGPYTIGTREILYPPIALVLLIPFTVLPALLWWVIPLGITGWVIAWHHPSRWGVALMLALLVPPAPLDFHFSDALKLIVTGNPGMWAMAAIAAGTRWAWPGALVLFKPSLLPFAAIGIRTRAWWSTLGVMVGVSVVLLPLMGQYVTVLMNARGPRAGLFYSITDLPLMLIPVVAWLTRRRSAAGSALPAQPAEAH